MSVKERVQMLQGGSSGPTVPVRRTDIAIPLKGIQTGPVEPESDMDNSEEPLFDKRELRKVDSGSDDEKLLRTPVRPKSVVSGGHSPTSRSSVHSTLTPYHQTPPTRILNPYDPGFSLQSQGSVASSVADLSEDCSSRAQTPPPTSCSDTVVTPIQANCPVRSLQHQQPLLDEIAHENSASLSSPNAPFALQRPMGRPDTHRYIVQISGAEWDIDIWKYRVMVQQRTSVTKAADNSFTQVFCFRSIPDFFWLEQALTLEFHGALLVPDLRIALQVATSAVETPVDPVLLEDWLSDVLNGYRGQGEWELPALPPLLHQSSSMESFLYKKLLQPPRPIAQENSAKKSNLHACSTTRACTDSTTGGCADAAPQSLVESLSALLPLDFCGVVLPSKSESLATAGELQVQDSLAETAEAVPLSVHSELLQAQRDLAVNFKASSLQCLDCLQTLVNQEERVGLAWRRLAEALGALFRYEADVDLSDAVRVKYMPYRKLEADVLIDEKLQQLVHAKATRSVPALREVQALLAAYIADLSAVEPSVQAYKRGRVTEISDSSSVMATSDEDDSDENISKQRWDDFRDWTRYNHETNGAYNIPPPPIKPGEFRKRFVSNEKLFRKNLTALFQTAPLRRCRMAWKYYSTEAKSCSELKTAAAAVRAELDVVRASSVSKLRKRHSRDEKSDYGTEMELLQRMVLLGHSQKVHYDSGAESTNSASIGDEIVEVDNDDIGEERSKAIKRDRALELARQRIGHWDAALATSIMEAVGVDDPNVRVEETTPQLRIVRKYVIALREQLDRCVDAVGALYEAVEKNGLKQSRTKFREAFAAVLSGRIQENHRTPAQRFPMASQSILRVTGIDMNDDMGWLSSDPMSQENLGDTSAHYNQTRDAQIEWLISSISDLFKDYYQRIEVIEGFVYMECVGIQLEKNFSAKRSKALTAFEKKADLTAALAIATKKRMKSVVDEVQSKLRTVDASQTMVKETKEAHLESKALKAALHQLAVRRLVRARELSTERATQIVEIWSKEEELNAQQEITALARALAQLESIVLERIPC